MIKDKLMGEKTRLQMEWDLVLVYLNRNQVQDIEKAMEWAESNVRTFCRKKELFGFQPSSWWER